MWRPAEQLFRRTQTADGGRLMRLTISLPAQTLVLHADDGRLLRRFQVSTAINGPGEIAGSFCTPRGQHTIRAKIGANAPANSVFVGRRPTGEIWTDALAREFPGRDWMLTRILWLSGEQPGKNRLGNCDTMRRYIYIHGSPDTAIMGTTGSIGCIRMANTDIIDLFELVPAFSRVDIDDYQISSGDWTTMQVAAKPLRQTVFVEEQGVPAEIELDEFDATSLHALACDASGLPIGTGRLLADGHVGRMAVAADWRGQGVGRALLVHLMDEARIRRYGELRLNAQTHAAAFYRQFGFQQIGDEFMEAGIPHCEMARRI